MSLFTKLGNDIASPVDAAGNPRSPSNQDFQVWMTEVERMSSALQAGGGIIFTDLAAANASLAYAANQMAWVIGDSTTANNGIYRKVGALGSGSWVRIGDLPYSMIRLTNAGAGTPDAIIATSPLPLPTTPGSAMFTVNIVAANTGPVTINGKPLLTNSGNPISAGGLTAPSMPAFVDLGDHYRLLSDQASEAILDAAIAAAARAETAQTAAESAAGANLSNADSVTAAEAENLPLSVKYVRTAGRLAPGDGEGGLYIDVNNGSEDTFVSADARIWYRAPDAGYFEPRPVTAPGFVRSVGDWMRERRSLTDFAPAATPSNWSPVAQMAIDEVLQAGGELLIPAGRYNLSTTVEIDVSETSGPPGPNRHRIKIQGQGAGNTVFYGQSNSMNMMHFIGSPSLGSGAHAYTELSDFSFFGNSPTQRTASGLRLEDLAYLRLRNLSYHNLFLGIDNKGCLSSLFDNLVFSEGVRGIQSDAGLSGPHSNVYIGCEFRWLTGLAYNGFAGLSGATFINARVEGCGTHGEMNTGGMVFRMSGGQGEAGPTFIGGYIENNAGGFDISLSEIGSQRVNANFFGTIFNRTSSSRHVVNNIKTDGEVDISLGGCTFTSYNSYVPSALRPYFNLSAATRLRDFGNRYEDAVEAPVLGQSLPYAGIVNGALGAGVTGVLPNGWTCSQDSTGVFRVTHNLGHTDYAVTATVNSGNNNAVRRVAKQSNYLLVAVRSEADSHVDDNFSFQLSVLKPRA